MPPPSPPPDGLPVRQRRWAMLSITIGITMSVLDSSVANIALPTIAAELHAAPAEAVWVVNAYQLAIVATLLPLAFLGERIGFRTVYQGGVALFTAGSLLCALSDSLGLLVAARIAQGFGAAGIMGVNGALVRHTYPLKSLGRGVGLNALVVSVAGALGPSVAAGVLAVGRWEWLFAVNVPLGLLNMALAACFLPRSERNGGRFDWLGAAGSSTVFAALFVGADLATHGARTGPGAILLLFGLLLAVWTVRQALRTERPLVPVDLMRDPVFALSVCASVCAFTAYSTAFLVLPFHFESVLHRDQVQTGLLMTAWPAAVGLVGPFAGRLSDRVSPALLGGVGMATFGAGLALMATLPAQASAASILWRMAVCGFGFGLFQAPNNRVMLGTAPRARTGAAGGMQATARLFGLTSGATLAAIGFRLLPGGADAPELWCCTALAVAAGGLSLGRLRRRRRAA